MANKVNEMFRKEVEKITERSERLKWGHSKTGRAMNRLVAKYKNKVNPSTQTFITDKNTPYSVGGISARDDLDIKGRNKNRFKFYQLYKKSELLGWSNKKLGEEWRKIQKFNIPEDEMGHWMKFIGKSALKKKKTMAKKFRR